MECLSFRSDDFEAGDAFEAYRALYKGGSDAVRTDLPFFAQLRAFRFPRMLVFDRRLGGVSHERNQKRVLRDGFDHVCLQYVLEGRMLVSVDNRAQIVEAGNIVAFDMTRPQRTWSEHARIITVAIARESVEDRLPPFVDLHGGVLPPTTSALFADFLASLARHGETVELPAATVATDTVAAFLGAVFRANADGFEASQVFRTAKLDQVFGYIERNLNAPDLNADTIAVAMAVSRSVLYRMFEPLNGVATYVQQRRLLAIRRALSSVQERRSYKAVAEAHGFVSASHATRSFRSAFGMTPGEFRKQRLDAHAGASRESVAELSAMESWFSEVM